MMKRVGFRGFKHFAIGPKMPLCLRLGSVGTNGDARTCDKCRDCPRCDSEANCPCEEFRKENCEYQRTKSNILNSIRKKWRRHKRNKRSGKRSDPVLNVCQNQEGEEHSTCVKHHRLKNQKPSLSPVNCNNNNPLSIGGASDGSVPKYSSAGGNEDEDCSCFGSPTRKTFSSLTAKVVKLKSHASKSMSDISAVTANISSPSAKTDSESDVCRLSLSNANISPKDMSHSDSFSMGSRDDVNTSFAQEPAVSPQLGPKFGVLTQELYKLSKYGWYWGPINRSEADAKLEDQPDGAFLVRDSSDDRYILSLSFRSCGKTLHTRIEHSNGLFSFYSQPDSEGHTSIVELINQSMTYSKSGAFCYSRGRLAGSVQFPVRLITPISRFTQVRSLQYLCRFIIRQYTRYDHIQKLPLPERIKGYLEKGPY